MQPVTFLAMALASLFAAPVIHRTFSSRPKVLRGIEIVSVSVILLIVVLHIQERQTGEGTS